ncbi:plasmid mobilization relaxosome protein MobC [Gemella sp. 19428wG2_WT2a]|nr:plasmid mobilization relaxosome protein MobC [Gemella sp. 19428wG2_WT2a]TFU60242.1 plasmid mobilization relaxosome protein MobC [Gemella sp. WT2a]
MENRRREILKKFYLNEKEEKKLKNKIEESPYVTFSAYAREMLLEGEIIVRDYSSIRKLQVELNRIGTNINQIAKVVNENRDINREEINELKDLFTELSKEVYRNIVYDEIGKRRQKKNRNIKCLDFF